MNGPLQATHWKRHPGQEGEQGGERRHRCREQGRRQEGI